MHSRSRRSVIRVLGAAALASWSKLAREHNIQIND